MVDIALCKNSKCSKKDSCLRFNKQDNQNAQYFRFQNVCHSENNYKWYWEHVTSTDLVIKEKDGKDGDGTNKDS